MMEVEVTSQLLGPDGRAFGMANQTTVASGDIANDPQVKALVRELSNWVGTTRGPNPARESMFDRTVYKPPSGPYDQMRTARYAVANDDIVGAACAATEFLAFQGGLKWESANPDEADVFNQMAADLNLDGKIREMWRETFSIEQFVCAKMWDWCDYTVRGMTTNGNKKKRRFRVWAPVRLIILNAANVVPIGIGPLREDNLAWQATETEVGIYNQRFVEDAPLDPLMNAFFTGIYAPSVYEVQQMAAWGVRSDRLLTMNPQWVFRHCNTRPDYTKFPELRMANVFALLDLKRQLMASDRSMMVGAANYILLIRKGSKETPATNDEVTNLKQNYNFLAKLPVIISDHRLEIDIIAPKLDFVLRKDAYDTLNTAINHAVLASFAAPGRTSTDATSTFSDIMAAGIQSRRHMIKRTLEVELGRAVIDHPKNKGLFEDRPSLVFTPRNVTVGANQVILAALLALRTQREISRDTILEYLGLDEATEAQRLEFEADMYDDIFKTAIPFTAPPGPNTPAPPAAKPKATPNGTPEAPAVSGGRGGRPPGGGESKKSPAATAKPKTGQGNPTTTKSGQDDQ